MNRSMSISGQIRSREAALEAEIDELIENANRTGSRNERVAYLIDKIRKRRSVLAIKPEFTPEVVGIAKQIVAFGGAGFGFVLTFSHDIAKDLTTLTSVLALLYINITLVSLAILIWFFCQARTRYP
jgi:hypothetical protein